MTHAPKDAGKNDAAAAGDAGLTRDAALDLAARWGGAPATWPDEAAAAAVAAMARTSPALAADLAAMTMLDETLAAMAEEAPPAPPEALTARILAGAVALRAGSTDRAAGRLAAPGPSAPPRPASNRAAPRLRAPARNPAARPASRAAGLRALAACAACAALGVWLGYAGPREVTEAAGAIWTPDAATGFAALELDLGAAMELDFPMAGLAPGDGEITTEGGGDE